MSIIREKSEQFRFKRDVHDCDVWSGSPLIANIEVYSNSNKDTTRCFLNSGIDSIGSIGLC